ncbi:hypothetical protein V2P57_00595 [Mycoplasma mycoides subsp. mycoides]|uniref:Uncharacterized protein n=2 Tax=Mycoplasma mycoides subsp. mycoides TaxID=2103 RepID=A0AAE2EI31_MYCMY|nr:hypothetical protein [Mycoplasma mycoides]CAE76763.1 Hypothetical transmembrane protein [Mycoplasma mycoides subsp. mycoides SC str. PG1]ADK69052.1 conserved hypothetical protein [Mycoplasma mycoides subsp. mycoides SC str. Gladysdale]AIZ54954.1 hypothetical protein mycmycITA_00123 [Mycoplasma mycoides subsp. mycoides]AMK56051.1 hypothetical protein MSCT144_01290 [Mycoplasma mycoides subsp. mycoides]KJQ45988.1 hypothetical protein TS59_0129 [Mycoplasma mycoides subsp. mycoides]
MQNKSGLILLKEVFINNYSNKIDFLKTIFSDKQINELESITNTKELLINLKGLLNNQILIHQNKIKEYQLELKKTNKKILNKLWLWWLLPIIGMFVFFIIYNTRLQNPYYANQLVDIKVKITDLDIKNIYIDKLLEEINSSIKLEF